MELLENFNFYLSIYGEGNTSKISWLADYFLSCLGCTFLFVPDLHHAQLDLDLIKKQAASTNREYDRLLKEHSDLQVIFLLFKLHKG